MRSIEKPDGELVVGPSLCVDHLLAATGSASVAVLDGAMGRRLASEPDVPLQLIDRVDHVDGADARGPTMFRSARVGLT